MELDEVVIGRMNCGNGERTGGTEREEVGLGLVMEQKSRRMAKGKERRERMIE